jgi:hypothetical protein
VKLTWKRKSPRVYFGYRGEEDCALLFGAPGDATLWCWVVWKRGEGHQITHVADYENSFVRAKAAAEKRCGGESDAG